LGKQAFDQKIEALDSLRSAPASPSTLEQLRKALKDRNNFYVSKAAALAGELGLQDLSPDLCSAFERFMTNPSKSDPQCWAKNAIAKALKDLGHDDPAIYIRGVKHFQPEPVWGGQSDSAAALRSTCALALVACPMDRTQILTYLVDLLLDRETPVRVDAVRAIGQLPGSDGALLLRLKALIGDRESEVTGQCFACLLDLFPGEYIPFVTDFLNAKNNAKNADLRLEAIAALGECRDPAALQVLKDCWDRQADPEVKRAILLSMAASRQPDAAGFLISVLEEGRPEDAVISVTALASGRFRESVREQAAIIVARRDDPKITEAFTKEFRN
jgi:hypothetical protein